MIDLAPGRPAWGFSFDARSFPRLRESVQLINMQLKDFISRLSDEEIRDARQMSPEDKFLEGARLFDRTCRIMKDGIRHEFPNASEDEVYAILLERLDMAERAESPA